MATPIHEKSSRKGVMYVYKLDTGNQPPPAAIKKSGGSKGWGGVLRRSKTYRENEQNRGEVIQEARKSVTVIEESRKSVSIVEDARKCVPPPTSNYYEEARKSVSSNVGEITRKCVPPAAPTTNYYEKGRKSVSHVGDTRKLSVPMYEEARKSVSVTEGRKSAVARMEMNVASMAALLQVKVMVTDMPGFMQVHAFRCARQTYDSLEKFSAKHMAHNLKKEFDKVYGPAWHCIVGSSFGSFVTHATGGFLYFSIEKMYILIFKTKVQKNPLNN